MLKVGQYLDYDDVITGPINNGSLIEGEVIETAERAILAVEGERFRVILVLDPNFKPPDGTPPTPAAPAMMAA